MLGFNQLGRTALGELPQFGEQEVVLSWYANWQPKLLGKSYRAVLAAPSLAIGLVPQSEVISPDKWFQMLSEPVRFRAFKASLQQAYIGWANPEVSFSWAWIEQPGPVRLKPGLRAPYHPYEAIDPSWIPRAEAYMAWYDWFSDPVRLPVGLKAWRQPYYFGPERTLPPADIFVTLDAIEVNDDVFSGALQVYNTVFRASVSIKEIPYQGDAALSIREP